MLHIHGMRRRFACEKLEKRVLLAAEILSFDSDPLDLWSASDPVEGPTQSGDPDAGVQGFSPLKAQDFELLSVDRQLLDSAVADTKVSIPRPDGSYDVFAVARSSVMPPELAAKFPEIQTFSGVSVTGNGDRLYADLSPNGFHAMVLSTSGNYYVDPFYYFDDRLYASYFTAGDFLIRGEERLEEGIERDYSRMDESYRDDDSNSVITVGSTNQAVSRSGTELRTYRTAVAATGEYTAFHGGTVQDGLAAVVTAMNRVSGVYESELSIRLQLVSNNDQLIYTNAAADPYTNNDGFALLGENQSNIDSVIGNDNYDVGHVFGTGGGGLAGLGVAGIDGFKAEGQTGSPNPINDAFTIDFVAHEFGHQFGGNHTFNGDSGSCAFNRNGSTAYEPGSGSTIQAYAGICGDDDLQSNSDAYFHSVSFDEMIQHVDQVIPDVGTRTSTGNIVPVVDGGSDYTIPAATPFTLTAIGLDGNGDVLTYNWEQRDLGPQRDVNAPDDGRGPIFRSFTPTEDPARTFPKLDDILAGTSTVGEQLPTTNRQLNFRVTARDNRMGGGGVATDDVRIDVVDTGRPFRILSPNSEVDWPAFSQQTVSWDVAGTIGSGINARMVDILLSTDGGNSFDTVLASRVPNTGSHTFIVPNILTDEARIKIQPVNNVFFDVSDENFTISQRGLTQDFGDAPAPYPTLLSDGGPLHVIGGPTLGFNIDPELDGQPSMLSDGDGDDEDGLIIMEPLIAGRTGSFTIVAPQGGQLEMYLDWDQDFVFGNAFGDTIQRTLVPGTQQISVPIPQSAPESVYVRMRISSTGAIGPGGVALDGEVEDHLINIYQTPPALDFGDAPASYSTLLSDNGARHVIDPTLFLGATVDEDEDGQITPMSTGDGRDDDGVVFRDLLFPGSEAEIQVTVTGTGVLESFFDFDGDGVFGNHPNEVFSTPVTDGEQSMTIAVPEMAARGATQARFRLSQQGRLGPYGLAFGGEVEDYQIVIAEDTRDRLLENFDQVPAPFLPFGWQTSDDGNRWFTANGSGEEQTHAAQIDAVRTATDTALVSPTFFVEVPETKVRFFNDFQLENEFDGGVFEISIDGSPYRDLLDAGGLFLQGGYTDTLNIGFGNPLSGRRAWTGLSDGPIETIAQLPDGTEGSMVSLRWRLGTDASVAEGAWRIDSIRYDGPMLTFDFGDAAEPQFQTINSPAHLFSDLTLGQLIDIDVEGNPSPLADQDDLLGIDDEDGVTFPEQWNIGENILEVEASHNAILNLWIDLEGNGVDESTDHIVKDLAVIAGTNFVTVSLDSLPVQATFARVRLSRQSALASDGLAGDGEVEDYRIESGALPHVNVEEVLINNGDAQRSHISSIQVIFDGETSPDPQAFSLINRSDQSIVGTIASVASIGGKTVVEMTPASTSEVPSANGSPALPNGNYELRIDADLVPGLSTDFVFGDEAADGFFRLFGDADGDRDVDGLDLGLFGTAFLTTQGSPDYNHAFDSDRDGDVDGIDLGAFGAAFLQRLPF